METPELPLIPGFEPRRITVDEFHAYAPEKIELLGGYVLDGQDRRRMLILLLVNMGLLEAVRLVPEDRWREALKRVHGDRTA